MRFIYGFLILIFLASCKKTEVQKPTLFKTIPSQQSGINFQNKLVSGPDMSIIEYLYFYNGAGVATGDINNDGLIDIYFSANQASDKLYLNQGRLTFTDISAESGIASFTGWSNGVTMVDINGDGWLDIYVCQVGDYKTLNGRNLLFLNNQDGTFTEAAKEVGLAFKGFSTHATFFDYDKDGDLDMYLLNHSVHTRRSYRSADSRTEFDELAGDRLFENKLNSGQLYFEDVSKKAGIFQSSQGYGLGLVAADINNDGWTDIYVGNDFHENDYLYINQQNGTFREELTHQIGHTSRFTMGVDIADLNQDQHHDIFTLDMLPYEAPILLKSAGEDPDKVTEIKLSYGYHHQMARNNFQLNSGDGYFQEIALMTETYATDWSWSVLLEDFDNNSYKDIFITNGIYKRPNDLDYINFLSNINMSLYAEDAQDSVEEELIRRMPTLKIPNFLYLNKGDLKFENDPALTGISEGSYSNGSSYADLDNDGDLDLVINNINQNAFLLENTTNSLTNNHYVKISLQYKEKNLFGIGSRIKVYVDEEVIERETTTSRGFMSSVSPDLTVGLGKNSDIDSIQIIWPDLSIETIKNNLKVDSSYIIKYIGSSELFKPAEIRKNISTSTLPFFHKENAFNDYEKESLIPHKISEEGPAFVMADVNGDGLNDVFIGGSHGISAQLWIAEKTGSYTEKLVQAFNNDKAYEDVDAQFIHLNDDDLPDLYVVSGGSEFEERAAILQDRIYINTGGDFSRLQTVLPADNGSCVAPSDIDGDGDIDFFVGTRSVPGAYGISPKSYILENINNRFKVVSTPEWGMITDAEWVDFDNDGQMELAVVGEWTPITIFDFDGFSFTKKNIPSLDNKLGWWNVIKFADLDDNGYVDFLAGNLGLNSKLKASEDQPVKLYVADFDFNGTVDPILFYHRDKSFVPFASRNELVTQIPMLKKKFLSYSEFSKVRSLDDLFKGDKIPNFETLSATFMESAVVYNYGDSVTMTPLPLEAQMSPIQDFELADIDMDGKSEILGAGNFLGPVSSLGRYDAQTGFILKKTEEGLDYDRALPLKPFISYRHIEKTDKSLMVIPNHETGVLIKFED